MVIAGKKNKNKKGNKLNNGCNLAWPIKKKSWKNNHKDTAEKRPAKINPKGETR
jgi:hypothetical protein